MCSSRADQLLSLSLHSLTTREASGLDLTRAGEEPSRSRQLLCALWDRALFYLLMRRRSSWTLLSFHVRCVRMRQKHLPETDTLKEISRWIKWLHLQNGTLLNSKLMPRRGKCWEIATVSLGTSKELLICPLAHPYVMVIIILIRVEGMVIDFKYL